MSGVLRVCRWCVPAVAVEIGVYASYRGHDARFHWFTHFFVGASAALLVMAVVAWRRRRPVPLPLVRVVAGHAVAMFPDVLFRFGVAHQRWMDVFLGHLSSHFLVGRNLSWYAVFLAALGVYLAVLDRLPATDDTNGPLSVRLSGDGPPVVLLHGLGASGRYWDRVVDHLPGSAVLAVDLLGFGRSPKPARGAYDVDAHLEALAPHVPDASVVVAHSTGAVLAAALARRRPDRVRALVLVGTPAFPDATTARREVGRLGLLARLTAEGHWAARLVCQVMCLLRPLAILVAPLVVRDVPAAVAADGPRHTWASYSRTLRRVVVHHRIVEDLAASDVPTTLLHGGRDRATPLSYAHQLARRLEAAGRAVTVSVVADGGHHLPLTHPERVAGAAADVLKPTGGRA